MSFSEVVAGAWEENRLMSVLVELTYRCNLDCVFCYNDLSLRGTPLTYAQYDALLCDLAAMNVLNLVLTGGEPLAHPDFFRIGARARELGFVVRVKTNGHAVHGELARRLRDEVAPFVVEVSLHGATAETHDRQTRVAGSFDRLLANVRELLGLGLRVKMNSTLTRWNEHEVESMYAIADEFKVALRFDLQVTPRDDGDRSPLALAATADGIRNLMEVGRRRAERDSPAAAPAKANATPATTKYCGAGSSGIAIDPFGNVYPCVQWRRPSGNLHERRLPEIWSDGFDEVRDATTAAKDVIAAHPRGRLLSFCPGLASTLTGSPLRVPEEMERVAAIVEQNVSG